MGISTEVFERVGIHLDPDEFDRLVAEAIADVVPVRWTPEPRSELSEEEASLLTEGGFSLEPPPLNGEHPIVRTAAAYAALLGSSLSVAQSAQRLGVNASRVRQRLAQRTLYGIKEPSGWRMPLFQFDGNRTVRGIERVLARLSPTLHPLAVVGWFMARNPDLTSGADERPMSPLDWLKAGQSVDVVADLAGDVGRIA